MSRTETEKVDHELHELHELYTRNSFNSWFTIKNSFNSFNSWFIKKNKGMKNVIMIGLALALLSCGSSSDNNSNEGTEQGANNTEVKAQTVRKASLTLSIMTDKACYRPGDLVTFTVTEGSVPDGAVVRYRRAGDEADTSAVHGTTWTWTAPSADFTGYLAEVFTRDGDTETVIGTVAIDVSSDWTRFPRYGFVATFDQTKTDEVIAEEMAFLSRCHINGIQFYDWHNKHHWPLGGTRTQLLDTYKDIANRDVVTSVVKRYIDVQHSLGMKAMFYNLCYGMLSDYQTDGAKTEWLMYKQTGHGDVDQLVLSNSWKSNILLTNPENEEWQKYLAERNDDVYQNFDFDGFHIDQVGDRGTVYDYSGQRVNLPRGFASFITAMKQAHPQKRLVMNAVSSFGASQIAQTGKVDFLYNELWDQEARFEDLLTVRRANSQYSQNKLQTIFAAYMNYGRSGQQGFFNTPGVLLTDATMFAVGGAHLELGDGHNLCHEYFPNQNLKMTDDLRLQLIRYYDFLVAYENLLRGEGLEETTVDITSGNAAVSINQWPPQQKRVTAYSRKTATRQIVHLLNYRQANSLSWRDMDGTMPAPVEVKALPLTVKTDRAVKRVWVATPDALGGAPVDLSFKQSAGTVTFTLPSLKYWTMIVFE